MWLKQKLPRKFRKVLASFHCIEIIATLIPPSFCSPSGVASGAHIGNIISSTIISSYEELLASNIALTFFIPLLIGSAVMRVPRQ